MAETCDAWLTGLLDRALFLLGFAAALRRSEMVTLEVKDLARVSEGLRLLVHHFKIG